MDEFNAQIAGLRQAIIDLDNDGVPDAPQNAMLSGRPKNGGYSVPSLPQHNLPTDGPRNAMYPAENQGSLKSSNTPFGDRAAAYLGTYGGAVASGFDRSMQGAVSDLKDKVNFLGEASGIPHAMRGMQAAGRGASQGDTIKQVGGLGQAALTALPFVGPAARAAFATAPRAMATVGGMGLAPVAASGLLSEANAGDASGAGRLDQLYLRQQSMQQELQRAISRRDQEAKSGEGPKFDAAQAAADLVQGQMTTIDREITDIRQRNSPEYKREQEKLRREQEASMPFRERYPEVAGVLPAAGLALSAGLPFGLKAVSRGMSWAPGLGTPSRVMRATEALEGAATSKNAMLVAQKNRELNALLATQNTTSKVGNALTSASAGGALTAEANLFPDQYDAFNLPSGDRQKEAHDRAMDPMAYVERGAIGTLTGLSGYKAAGLIPERPINFGRARGAQAIADPRFANEVTTVRQNMRAATQPLPKPPNPKPTQPEPPMPPNQGQPAPSSAGGSKPSSGQGSGTEPPTSGPQKPQGGGKPESNGGKPPKGGDNSVGKPSMSSKNIASVRDRFIANDGKLTIKDWQELAPSITAKQRENLAKKLSDQLQDAGSLDVMRRMSRHLKSGTGIIGGSALAGAYIDE